MIRSALVLALLLPLGSYHPQYLPAGPHFPTAAPCPVLAAWPMNEGSGSVFNDVSGNANTVNASVPGVITWTANAIKSGVTSPFFNGGTGGVGPQDTLGSNINFTGTTPFTIALWVNRGTSTTIDTYLGDLASPIVFNGWEVAKDTSGNNNRARFAVITNANASSLLIVDSTNAIPANAITYLVFTYDGSQTAAGVKIYINGVVETNIVLNNTLTGNSASPNQRTFGRAQNQGQAFTGPMGFVEIAGCVWNQTKISANFAGGPAIN